LDVEEIELQTDHWGYNVALEVSGTCSASEKNMKFAKRKTFMPARRKGDIGIGRKYGGSEKGIKEKKKREKRDFGGETILFVKHSKRNKAERKKASFSPDCTKGDQRGGIPSRKGLRTSLSTTEDD